MQFNSVHFFLFFPVVCCLYFNLPYRVRWVLLLAASYYFYAVWEPLYLLLILASTAVDYCAGLAMARAKTKSLRLWCLLGSLSCNLGLLFTFKYFNLFSDSLAALCELAGLSYQAPQHGWLLPIGISFYTFQTLSYTIEVFRGTHEPERHVGIFALYVAFFPQLVAGPIERSTRFLPQLREKHDFDYDRVVDGLRLMLWGMFKKVVVADRLGLIVDHVYATPERFQGPVLALATIFFAFQIYCDFSGYSDIAIGGARVLGYRLMVNFDRPYVARSIGEFWHRWHISLSTWFRDYVYIPLGGGRVGAHRFRFNIMAVFVVSGLWHGANWTFVIWGALHGLYYVLAHATANLRGKAATWTTLDRRPRLYGAVQWATTFFLVCIAWVFFRAATLPQALHVFAGMFRGWRMFFDPGSYAVLNEHLQTSWPALAATLGALAFLLVLEHFQEKGKPSRLLSLSPTPLRWAVYTVLVLAMFKFGIDHEIPFIYFQF